MNGILVDVSASMSTAYYLGDAACSDVSVQRTHALFTTVSKIAERELTRRGRRDKMFACAFGLRKPLSKKVQVCNLIEFFAKLRKFNASISSGRGRDNLVALAKQHGAPHAEYWITEHISEEIASLLHWQLLNGDKTWIPRLLEKFPSRLKTALTRKTIRTAPDIVLRLLPRTQHGPASGDQTQPAQQRPRRGRRVLDDDVQEELNTRLNVEPSVPSPPQATLPSPSPSPSPPPSPHSLEERTMKMSNAYTFIEEVISDVSVSFLESLAKEIKPRSVRRVSKWMRELIARPLREDESAASAEQAMHGNIQKMVDKMAPFIYGQTPMRTAMDKVLQVFKKADADITKVLFIISDGKSTDGDPLPIAQELHALGVRIVTCYLTSDHIDNQKCLLDEPNPNWTGGQHALFRMSSTMKNTHTPISYLVDAGWELPPSGESRLFVQSNSLNIVNELCETVVSHMTEECDALVDALGKVDLATYINQANASFIPRDQQQEATCYAHAIAATFHLAMHRIVGREGGVPDFNTIRDRLISLYGRHGAYTEQVLQAVCPEYRLHFKAVDETGARQAINQRRPVVARFQLYPKQWERFRIFFANTGKGILKKDDIQTGK